MADKISHLAWGIVLTLFFEILHSMHPPLMRLCNALSHSQTLALQFVGESLSLLPFVGIIWRQWSLKTKTEWIVISLQSLFLAGDLLILVYCSQHIPLGTLRNLQSETDTQTKAQSRTQIERSKRAS